MMDQKTEPAIVAIASGYTMNTRPGPEKNAQFTEHSNTEITRRGLRLICLLKRNGCY
jgi:hypothetical protein